MEAGRGMTRLAKTSRKLRPAIRNGERDWQIGGEELERREGVSAVAREPSKLFPVWSKSETRIRRRDASRRPSLGDAELHGPASD